MANSLHGYVVLIIGASSGFGEHAARRLEKLQALAADLQNEGSEALALPVELNEGAAIDVMVQTALDLYRGLDSLPNFEEEP